MMFWGGWIMSALPVLMLVSSAIMKFIKPAALTEGFTHLGYDMKLAVGLGVLELTCTCLYLIPITSIVGAILLTGYLGGAIATHLRVGDSVLAPVILALFVWGGLFLRDARLREMIPLRKREDK
jgi:hypothetical protein